MKKIASSMVALVLAAMTSQAALMIDWHDYTGFSMNDNVTAILDAGVGSQALVQLIFTASGTQSAALIGGAASGDNVILDQQVIDSAVLGNDYGAGFSYSYVNADMVGSLFVRVFQGGTSIGNVSPGAWYFNGYLHTAVVNPGPPAAPDAVPAGVPPGGGTGPFGTYALNQQVVPEPTTLALAALGVLGVVVRRFRRS